MRAALGYGNSGELSSFLFIGFVESIFCKFTYQEEEMKQEMQTSASRQGGIMNVNQLKYLAAAFMAVDSLYQAFVSVLPSWMHLITRFVGPLFAFLMVEGFFHTHDRVKYLRRLWLAAFLMEIGDYISLLLLGNRKWISDNIFLTLAVGFTMIYVIEMGKQAGQKRRKVLLYILGGLIFAAGYVFSIVPIQIGDLIIGLEGGMQDLAVILIFYLFYGNRRKQVIVFLIWNLVFLLATGGVALPGNYTSLGLWFSDFCYNSEGLTFLFLPFIFLYNGQKGRKSAFDKYFFYIFYPAHLWIIHIAALLILGGKG